MTKSEPKKGVILVNLGSPDAPNKKAVRKYLKQFLSDERVIQPVFGKLVWWLVLNVIILNTRPQKSAKLYQSIWGKFGNGSPLIDITKKQCARLQNRLVDSDVEVVMAMRYGSPSITSAVQKLLNTGVEELLVLPLYPQYSCTTTESVFDVINQLNKQPGFPVVGLINNYHDSPAYILALKNTILKHQELHGKPQKLIISFHGIPETYVQKGDIYPQQCQKTTALLIESLGLNDNEYMLCYQSIFGKLEWIKPYLDKTLKALPAQGIKNVQIICPGFAADCLETLEEIEIENKNFFLQAGGESYSYIPALNDNHEHMLCLEQLIRKNLFD